MFYVIPLTFLAGAFLGYRIGKAWGIIEARTHFYSTRKGNY